MLQWIRRGTRLFAGVVFFIVLANVLLTEQSFGMETLLRGATLAFFGAVLFWFVGFVVLDIIIKGLVTDIEDNSVDTLIDGGMLQRVKEMQEQYVPGGEEMPFNSPAGAESRS